MGNTASPCRRSLQGSAARTPPSLLLLALLIVPLAVRPASAQEGALRVYSTSAGQLRLEHESEWITYVAIAAGPSTIWSLPAGEYEVSFRPAASPSPEEAAGSAMAQREPLRQRLAKTVWTTWLRIWGGVTTRIDVRAQEGRLLEYAGPEEAGGAVLLLPHSLLEGLPGTPAEILASLDTHTRARPGILLDGLQLAVPAERREILPGDGSSARAAVIRLSPSLPSGARWSLDTGTDDIRSLERSTTWGNRAPLPLHATAGYLGSRHEDGILTAHGRLDPRDLLGVPIGGRFWLETAQRENASPRAVGERILPHNDSRSLALNGRLDLGSPAAGILGGLPRDGAAIGISKALPWGLALRMTAQGYRRDYYEQIYRFDLAHAPYEETAFIEGEAALALKVAPEMRGRFTLGYGSYETSISDGTFRRDLQAYYTPGVNPGADGSGLYWLGEGSGELSGAHVYDYYRWHSSRELRALAGLDWQRGASELWQASADVRLLTYRRFEHFSPTTLGSFTASGRLADALIIGYDAETGSPADDPFVPGQAFCGRLALRTERVLREDVIVELAAGGMLFSSRDSALASIRTPYGTDYDLEAGDFRAPLWHARPEIRIALARRTPGADGVPKPGVRGLEWWGLLFQRAELPPLEALYSPRAYLAQTEPEGVMGNPALAPEVERGVEVGVSLPAPFTRAPARLTIAGYASHRQDAVTMAAAQVGPSRGFLDTDWLPVYENGGSLRHYGLHLEATAGRPEGRLWARLSYDLSRLESDRFEAPLLDARWLYADLAQGEYESEGYAGPAGGILDELLADTAARAAYRPANADRLHTLSLALLARPHMSPESDWPGVLRDWTIGAIARVATGRPYTMVYVYPAGAAPVAIEDARGLDDPAWAQVAVGRDPNGARMPATVRVDLAFTRGIELGSRRMTLGIEALNLLATENAVAVYRATGKPDEDACGDACLEGADDLAEADPDGYSERLLDPAHYDAAFELRGWIRLELF
ncbi:MAG: TonB-dependent receptor [Candidatus Eisenbacteria bacterium]